MLKVTYEQFNHTRKLSEIPEGTIFTWGNRSVPAIRTHNGIQMLGEKTKRETALLSVFKNYLELEATLIINAPEPTESW